jgi:hypothetical protein
MLSSYQQLDFQVDENCPYFCDDFFLLFFTAPGDMLLSFSSSSSLGADMRFNQTFGNCFTSILFGCNLFRRSLCEEMKQVYHRWQNIMYKGCLGNFEGIKLEWPSLVGQQMKKLQTK